MPATIEAPSAADIARMATVADATLADTFHWPRTEEERLYRECPTAFWLAPGGDDALPPIEGPSPATSIKVHAENAPLAIDLRAEGTGAAMGLASVLAGPIFVAAFGLTYGGGISIERLVTWLALALMSLPLSVPFGAIAAIAPIFLGVSVLAHLGAGNIIARRRGLWAATGAGMGLLISAAFDAGIVSVSLVLTSIACAVIAHRAIDWIEPELA